MQPHSFVYFLQRPCWTYDFDLKHKHVHINIPSETHHFLVICPNRYRKKVAKKKIKHLEAYTQNTYQYVCVCISDSSLAKPHCLLHQQSHLPAP